jgi:IS5 family transposase
MNPPFDASLFVDIRERLGLDVTTAISELIMIHHIDKVQPVTESSDDESSEVGNTEGNEIEQNNQELPNKGSLLLDATVSPQNVTFPTDLKVLNSAREKSEEIIDKLYNKNKHGIVKPRTYREIARKDFLTTNKKKHKSRAEIEMLLQNNLGILSET